MSYNIKLLTIVLTMIISINAENHSDGGDLIKSFNSPDNYPGLSMNFMKFTRSIRNPFRNTGIMTARGFGKRSDSDSNDINNINEKRDSKPITFPFYQPATKELEQQQQQPQVQSLQQEPPRNHRLQIRDMPGILKFRLNDGNLRIGRGFGKRSYQLDDTKDDYEQSNEDNIKM